MTTGGASSAGMTGPRRPLPTGEEYGLADLVSMLARHRRVTVGFPLSLGLLAAIVSLLVPPTYTATTTFVPEARSQSRLPSGLAGLAAQFGLPVGSEASKSPKFYAEVARSRELMEHVLLSNYVDPRRKENTATDSATLLHVLGVNGRDSADSLYRGVKKLNNLVSVRANDQTNIVTLSVDAHYPALAAAVANKFVEYLNTFNAHYRQSQAREQRKFVEQRLADGESELRRAEDELRSFYERNRTWQQSPQLTFEEGRLRRRVDVQQELYLTLKREYETARIQEVNDTPVITVIDSAAAPAKKSKPKRVLLTMTALVLGAMLGAFWAAGTEYFRRSRDERARRS